VTPWCRLFVLDCSWHSKQLKDWKLLDRWQSEHEWPECLPDWMGKSWVKFAPSKPDAFVPWHCEQSSGNPAVRWFGSVVLL
jgi:3-methyladenine DNA glycosylase AlkD